MLRPKLEIHFDYLEPSFLGALDLPMVKQKTKLAFVLQNPTSEGSPGKAELELGKANKRILFFSASAKGMPLIPQTAELPHDLPAATTEKTALIKLS